MKHQRAEKRLSVGVVTRDLDEKFYRLWESLKPLKKVLREVVVLADPGSFREKTRLKELPLKIFRSPWQGFPRQKNKLLSLCRGEWILLLDADERLTRDAALQIHDVVCRKETPFSVYRIPRRNFFAGRLVFSWNPDEQIRLFRKGSGVFEEQHPVHERFQTTLPCGRLTAALEHDSYDSIEHFLEKSNRYTSLEVSLPRTEKYRRFFYYYLFVDPWVTVWRIFFRHGEWRYGWFGFQISVLAAFSPLAARAENMGAQTMKAWFYGMACVSPFLLLVGRAARGWPGTWASLFAERCGFYPPFSGEASLWVHAASAGEVRSVSALIRKFQASFPETPVVLTATSATGLKVAEKELQGVFSFAAPLDVPGAVERAFRTFRPKLLLVAETELWPVLFSQAKRRGVPLWIINGRLSDRSFPIYRKVSWLFRSILKDVARGFVQTEKDKQRFLTLGIPGDRLCVVGQMKYDLQKPPVERTQALGRAIGVRRGETWFVFASLREGEEKLLEMIPDFLKRHPKARFLVASRYLSFLPKLEEVLKGLGLRAARRSGKVTGEKVVLLDTLGELLAFFPLARGAFVGGTWVPGIGGHNVLEPALGGVPTAFGPYYANVAEAAEALMQSGAGVCVRDPADLKAFWESLCAEQVFQERRRKIRRVLRGLSGATEKTFAALKAFWRAKP